MVDPNWLILTLCPHPLLLPLVLLLLRALLRLWDFYTYRTINRSIKSPDNSLSGSNLVPPAGAVTP